MYEFLREKTTSFSALLGIDTTSVFLHGVRLSTKKKTVAGSCDLWHAVKNKKGIAVFMQCSHGPAGREWKPASRRTTRAVIQKTARELSKYVVGGTSVAYIEHRLRTGNLTRMDGTTDIEDATMHRITVVAPKEKYGPMRDVQYRNGPTQYWGKRGGYMKDPGGEYIIDENGKQIYERPSAKQVRVYDKRRQMLDTYGIDIGKEVTRIEIQLNGNRAIRQNLGFGTLDEYLNSTDEELRLRVLFDELTVAVDGQCVDPLTPEQRRQANGNPSLAKKLRRNERRKIREEEKQRRKKETLGITDETGCQDTHCLYEDDPGAWEFRRGIWSFIPEGSGPCPGAGGTPGRVKDGAGAG